MIKTPNPERQQEIKHVADLIASGIPVNYDMAVRFIESLKIRPSRVFRQLFGGWVLLKHKGPHKNLLEAHCAGFEFNTREFVIQKNFVCLKIVWDLEDYTLTVTGYYMDPHMVSSGVSMHGKPRKQLTWKKAHKTIGKLKNLLDLIEVMCNIARITEKTWKEKL